MEEQEGRRKERLSSGRRGRVRLIIVVQQGVASIEIGVSRTSIDEKIERLGLLVALASFEVWMRCQDLSPAEPPVLHCIIGKPQLQCHVVEFRHFTSPMIVHASVALVHFTIPAQSDPSASVLLVSH